MSSKQQWIGSEGAAFERVGMAFESLGYVAPRGDNESAEGGYAMNIARQYQSNLSERAALAIISYALNHSLIALRNRTMSERDDLAQYGE